MVRCVFQNHFLFISSIYNSLKKVINNFFTLCQGTFPIYYLRFAKNPQLGKLQPTLRALTHLLPPVQPRSMQKFSYAPWKIYLLDIYLSQMGAKNHSLPFYKALHLRIKHTGDWNRRPEFRLSHNLGMEDISNLFLLLFFARVAT